MISILQMDKLKLGEVKGLLKGESTRASKGTAPPAVQLRDLLSFTSPGGLLEMHVPRPADFLNQKLWR